MRVYAISRRGDFVSDITKVSRKGERPPCGAAFPSLSSRANGDREQTACGLRPCAAALRLRPPQRKRAMRAQPGGRLGAQRSPPGPLRWPAELGRLAWCAPCARLRWRPRRAGQVSGTGRRGPAAHHPTGAAAAPEHHAAKDQRGHGLCAAARGRRRPGGPLPLRRRAGRATAPTAAPQGLAGASARPRRAGQRTAAEGGRRPHRERWGAAVRPVWMGARHQSTPRPFAVSRVAAPSREPGGGDAGRGVSLPRGAGYVSPSQTGRDGYEPSVCWTGAAAGCSSGGSGSRLKSERTGGVCFDRPQVCEPRGFTP